MQTNEEIKEVVRKKYAEIAVSNTDCGCSCCGTDSGATIDYSIMNDDYSKIEGYVPDADLGLGCGLPTQYAGIKEGDTVLDLGSGAGNDVFIARSVVGPTGKVIGIDFTDEMLIQARKNCDKTGYNNVVFRKGDIEDMPVADNTIDVVVSNCVLNLVPDKQKAFSEIFRVLKTGGHFSVSDIVLNGELPEKLKNAASMYTGCVAGALQVEDYMGIIRDAGFSGISVPKVKNIDIPDDIMQKFLNDEEFNAYKNSGVDILSVTVNASKNKTGCCC